MDKLSEQLKNGTEIANNLNLFAESRANPLMLFFVPRLIIRCSKHLSLFCYDFRIDASPPFKTN